MEGCKDKDVCSFSSERSYTGSFLEDAEEDNSTEASFNQSSYFKSTCLSFPSSPLMAEVLAEFTHRMKTMEQNDVSFDWYFYTFFHPFGSECKHF